MGHRSILREMIEHLEERITFNKIELCLQVRIFDFINALCNPSTDSR